MARKSPARFSSLPALFLERAHSFGDVPFMRKQRDGNLATYTWKQAFDRVERIAACLVKRGFRAGDRAAIMAENGPDYAFADLAIQMAGGAVVPIYTTSSTEEIVHILADSDSSVLFLGKEARPGKVREAIALRPLPLGCVTLEGAQDRFGPTECSPMARWMDSPPPPEEIAEVQNRCSALNREHLSAVIYTSGTTGPSKGVMLTHGNILANLEAVLRVVPLNERDTFLSFLPMSHSFERSMGFYGVVAAGAFIHFARSMGSVPQDFKIAAPTVAMVVPRFLEKLHQRLMEAVEGLAPPLRLAARVSLHLRGKAASRRRRGERVSFALRLLDAALRAGSMSRLRKQLGGRLRFLVCGGAAMSLELWEFFDSLGITVIQGYGLTETSPVVSVNPLENNRPASVGLPLQNVSVRIASDGEIEVSGPSIMKGYWNRFEESAQVIGPDGWLKTGDLGRLDEQGFLYITGRKKEILVTSTGKNIAPQKIEIALSMDPLIEYACVVGEGRSILAALLSPNLESLDRFTRKELGLDGSDLEHRLSDPRVIARFQKTVDQVNQQLGQHEKIQKFRLLREPFSLDNGVLTPTLKIRRAQVEARYASEIQSLFPS